MGWCCGLGRVEWVERRPELSGVAVIGVGLVLTPLLTTRPSLLPWEGWGWTVDCGLWTVGCGEHPLLVAGNIKHMLRV